jgi:hypothetical protein
MRGPLYGLGSGDHPRQQISGKKIVAFGVEVDSVPLVKIRGHDRVFKGDDFDVSCSQSAYDGRDICIALLLRTEEAQIVAAGIENHNRCPDWHSGIHPPQHSSRGVKAYSSIRDVRIIALGLQHASNRAGYAICEPTPQPDVLLAPSATMFSAAAAAPPIPKPTLKSPRTITR